MSRPGRPLLTRAESRAADRALMDAGVPGIVLMENAGRAATDLLARDLGGHLERPVVVGGTGQNGGDAWVVARHLLARGHSPEVFLVGDPGDVRGDAQIALDALRGCATSQPAAIHTLDDLAPLAHAITAATLVIDGLFGTGLDRPLTGLHLDVVRLLDACRARKVALDLPSGVCADTGQILGAAPAVDLTITFHAEKRGLHHHPGTRLAGRVRIADLGVPAPTEAGAWVIDATDLARTTAPRADDAHKGSAGHVLVIGGSPGKTGAALLAGLGAMRAGAGLVTLAARGATRIALDAKVIELMTREVPEALEAGVATVLGDAARASSAVLGPGLGLDDTTRAFARRLALELPIPTVLDADALRAIASDGGLTILSRAAAPRVLTPHPAEAAHLLGVTTAEVQSDRFETALRLARASRQVVVLKGARTIIAHGERLLVCACGTPALAAAGTGDVLAGVIAAFLADRPAATLADPLDDADPPALTAAWRGVVAHAVAGERAAGGRDRGLLAHEVADAVSFVVSSSSRSKL